MDRFESLENPRQIILKLIPSSAPSSAENLRTAHTRSTEAPSTSPFSSPTYPRRTRRHGSAKGGEGKHGKPPSKATSEGKNTRRSARVARRVADDVDVVVAAAVVVVVVVEDGCSVGGGGKVGKKYGRSGLDH